MLAHLEAFPSRRGIHTKLRRSRERIQPHEHHRPLTSHKGVAMLGDKGLDCKRRLPSARFNEFVGSREYSVGIVEGDLPLVLYHVLVARMSLSPIAFRFVVSTLISLLAFPRSC